MKREIILAQLLAGEWLLLQLKRPVLQPPVTRALSYLIHFPLSASRIYSLVQAGCLWPVQMMQIILPALHEKHLRYR